MTARPEKLSRSLRFLLFPQEYLVMTFISVTSLVTILDSGGLLSEVVRLLESLGVAGHPFQ